MSRIGREWAPRSSADILQERWLQRALETERKLKSKSEANLAALGKDKERALQAVRNGAVYGQDMLGKVLLDIENEQRKVQTFAETVSEAEARVEDFRRATCAQAGDRLKAQNDLAQLVAERLEKDEVVEERLQELRRLLVDRASLAAKIEGVAKTIGLECALDATPPALLLRSLPATILPDCKTWMAWFLGDPEALTPYIVIDKELTVEETLGRPGIYSFGETVRLRPEEAKELLREDRPAPNQRYAWDYLPPSVMTVDAHKAAVAEAEADGRGADISFVLIRMRADREEKAREAHLVRSRAPVKLPASSVETGPVLVNIRSLIAG